MNLFTVLLYHYTKKASIVYCYYKGSENLNKYIFSVLFLMLFSAGYIFLYFSDSNKNENIGTLPTVGNAFSRFSVTDRPFENKSRELPNVVPAKRIMIDSSNLDLKTAKTAWTFPRDVKTREKRLTPEEIAKAPIVDIIKMNINNKDYNIVVVEKDGKTYDASDGVRIYVPTDFTEARRKAGLL